MKTGIIFAVIGLFVAILFLETMFRQNQIDIGYFLISMVCCIISAASFYKGAETLIEITPTLLEKKGFLKISGGDFSSTFQKGPWLLKITTKGTEVYFSSLEMSPWRSLNLIIHSWDEFEKIRSTTPNLKESQSFLNFK